MYIIASTFLKVGIDDSERPDPSVQVEQVAVFRRIVFQKAIHVLVQFRGHLVVGLTKVNC